MAVLALSAPNGVGLGERGGGASETGSGDALSII